MFNPIGIRHWAVDRAAGTGRPAGPTDLKRGAAKSFDEHSDHNGGRFRCGETVSTPAVTYPPPPAPFTARRARPAMPSSDVDDFDTGVTGWTPTCLQTDAGRQRPELSPLSIRIAVTPDTLFGSTGPGPVYRQARRPDGASAG